PAYTPALPDALPIFEISLERCQPGETVPLLRTGSYDALCEVKTTMQRWLQGRSVAYRQSTRALAPCDNEIWRPLLVIAADAGPRSEEHTSELQSLAY